MIISAVTVTTLSFFVIGLGLKAQRAKPATGVEGMVGETGEALDILNPFGNAGTWGNMKPESVEEGQIDQGEKYG